MAGTADLAALAVLAGIKPEYWDIFGTHHVASPDVQRGILDAMGIDATSPAAIEQAQHDLEARPWREVLGPIQVVRRPGPLAASLTLPADADGPVRWHLELESREPRSGEARAGDLAVAGTGTAGGQAYARRWLPMPDGIPDGYHRLTVEFPGGKADTVLAVAPATAYRGPEGRETKYWGLACQLYAARSVHDWGMGDFGTLGTLATAARELGADVLGINPLHALLTRHPELASPYLPSSRIFVNPLYIDVPAAAAAEGADIAALEARAPALRNARLVDYAGVSTFKRQAFAALYDAFKRHYPEGGGAPRRQSFDRFRAEAGETLTQFCLFQALHDHFDGQAWSTWPGEFQDVNGAAVEAFADRHRDAVLYHAYLQWIAEEQLAAAAARCGTGTDGMAVGLYRDIAVGSDSTGADAWTMRDLYAQGSRVGAPPDAFNPKGQDWGTPPPRPEVSRQRAHVPFVAALRANMRHAGALRIDHAMALQQLYWIPPGAPATEGAYVRYPMDELLGLVALESHRNRCLVIGEDLGTVTDEFRERTNAESIYSYRVFYFERYAEGLFKRPEAYPTAALATAGTHDLPTIRGHWVGRDIAWWAEHNGDDAETRRRAEEARRAERALIVSALADQGLVESEFPLEGDDEETIRRLIVAIQKFIARSPARLVMVNLDDALVELDPLNIPGTVDEYPNWRRRHPLSVEELLADPFVRDLASAVTAERRGV